MIHDTAQSALPPPPVPSGVLVNGVLPIRSLASLQAEEKRAAQQRNNEPHITSLASHCRKIWEAARTAKEQTVEPRLLACLRQRDGKYDEQTLSKIRQQGGAEIYMMLSSNKARAASSWLRDVMLGTGAERPWTVQPTPIPSMPPEVAQAAFAQMQQELQQYAQMGLVPNQQELHEYVTARKESIMNGLREQAAAAAERMGDKMEDQLVEGRFYEAFSAFIDDLVTFPYAILKGPVVRKERRLAWVPGPNGAVPQVTDELVPCWERVDPFMIYWAAHATKPDEGDLIERHRLTRGQLYSMIGVEGYDEGAIRQVLDEYGRGGLREWLSIDSSKAEAENKHYSAAQENPGQLIDALQIWTCVQGKLLIEWGVPEEQIPDPLAEYEAEVWLVGRWVIKAVLSADPLYRKPYFKASYEIVPGSWMGNSVMDLTRDCQDMCNAAARALKSNMGIASGPQVWVNVDRLPPGENITQMYPWKLWQTTADPVGGTAPPMDFFQPNSLANELMTIYERFSVLADEYSGVPRYMTGDSPAGGAGRTASGMSMLMNNAGKSIKQVVMNIDKNVLEPLLERQAFHNNRYAEDMDLKGDMQIVARGAANLVVKDSAQVRRNEFMQLALNSPVVQQVVGMEGIAHLLRETVKTLDMNPDKVVPAPEVMKLKMMAQILQERMAAMQQVNAEQAAAAGTPAKPGGGEQLMDGSPVTDNFSPAPAL